LQNDLSELWSVLHWLFPEIFTAHTSMPFKESFLLSAGKVDLEFLAHTRNLLKLIMLRRLKDSPGIAINIPPKTEITLLVPLSKLQRHWYSKLLTGFDQSLLDVLLLESRKEEQAGFQENGWETPKYKKLNNLLMQLRKVRDIKGMGVIWGSLLTFSVLCSSISSRDARPRCVQS